MQKFLISFSFHFALLEYFNFPKNLRKGWGLSQNEFVLNKSESVSRYLKDLNKDLGKAIIQS